MVRSFNLGRAIQVSLLYSCLINIVHTGRNDNTLNARIQLSFFSFLAAVDNCNRISFWAIVTEDEGEQGKLFYDIILCTFIEPFIFLVPVWLFLLDEVPWSSDWKQAGRGCFLLWYLCIVIMIYSLQMFFLFFSVGRCVGSAATVAGLEFLELHWSREPRSRSNRCSLF